VVADPAHVPQRVSAALSVIETSNRLALDSLTRALPPRQTLLILENCEHLLLACAALIHALLVGCPRVWIFDPCHPPGARPERAGACIRKSSPQPIAGRPGKAFRLLTRAAPDSTRGHATLRAAMKWS
jgi:predicted ATPase